MELKLWKHQSDALDLFPNRPCLALLFEMGCGKTLTAIECLRKLSTRLGHTPQTVVCVPGGLIATWQREIAKYAPELSSQITVAEGTQKQRATAIRQAKPILLLPHTSLIMLEVTEQLSLKRFDCLIVDELHKFRSEKARSTKSLIRLAQKFKYRLGLTGSPVLRGYEDLWAQFAVIDPAIFGDNFFSFRAKYFIDKNARMPASVHFPKFVPWDGAEKALWEKIGPAAIVAKKSECLDLPPLVKIRHDIELTTSLRAPYLAMERDFIATFESNTVVADLAITQMMRLTQISCGIISGDDGSVTKVPTEKDALLAELLEQLVGNHKVIVWTSFVPTYGVIAETIDKLGVSFVSIVGGQSREERDEAVEAFQNDKGVRVCIANQASGGVGLNLQAADYSIYYSKTFNLEHDLQSEARNYRGGSEVHERVTRIDLVTASTIEEEIHDALERKASLGELLLAHRIRCVGGENRAA